MTKEGKKKKYGRRSDGQRKNQQKKVITKAGNVITTNWHENLGSFSSSALVSIDRFSFKILRHWVCMKMYLLHACA